MEDVTDFIEDNCGAPSGYPYGVAYRGKTVAWLAARDQFQEWLSTNPSVQEFMDHMVHFCAPVDTDNSASTRLIAGYYRRPRVISRGF